MIRKARLTDIKGIYDLIQPFAKQEIMLPLALGDLVERIRDFHVAEENGEVIGSVALHVAWDTLVEIRSLAVKEIWQKKGLGRQLVEAVLCEAVDLGAEEVFTLTYIPSFFEKFGFVRIDRQRLPHKVWQDCIKCTKFPDCGEVALLKRLER